MNDSQHWADLDAFFAPATNNSAPNADGDADGEQEHMELTEVSWEGTWMEPHKDVFTAEQRASGQWIMWPTLAGAAGAATGVDMKGRSYTVSWRHSDGEGHFNLEVVPSHRGRVPLTWCAGEGGGLATRITSHACQEEVILGRLDAA